MKNKHRAKLIQDILESYRKITGSDEVLNEKD